MHTTSKSMRNVLKRRRDIFPKINYPNYSTQWPVQRRKINPSKVPVGDLIVDINVMEHWIDSEVKSYFTSLNRPL